MDESLVAVFTAANVAVALGLAMLATWQIGVKMGCSLRRRNPEGQPSKFDDASIALLGLLLAFTFGVSISKHDQRRLAVVADSNAIGDFYTCATLLNEPIRTELRRTIRDYTELRVNLARRATDNAELDTALVRFAQMQGRMSELVGQALRNGTPIAVSLTNTLNEVTSNHASRLSAVRDVLPTSVLVLLCVSAIVTALLIGREQGFAGPSEVLGTFCFVLMVSLAIYTTIDLNQPNRGFIRVSQESMERLYSSMPKD
jgi:hypothetical protein